MNKLLPMDLPLYMNITTNCKEESIVVEKSAVVHAGQFFGEFMWVMADPLIITYSLKSTQQY